MTELHYPTGAGCANPRFFWVGFWVWVGLAPAPAPALVLVLVLVLFWVGLWQQRSACSISISRQVRQPQGSWRCVHHAIRAGCTGPCSYSACRDPRCSRACFPSPAAPSPTAPSSSQGGGGSGSGSGTSGGSSGSTGTDSTAGAQAAGSPCSNEGEWNCVGGSAFQRCASGTWSAVMQLSAGTTCSGGQGPTIDIVSKAGKKRRVALRFRG